MEFLHTHFSSHQEHQIVAMVWVILVEVIVLEMEVVAVFLFVDLVLDSFVLGHFVFYMVGFLVHHFDSPFLTLFE